MDDEPKEEPFEGPLLGRVVSQQQPPPQPKSTIVYLDGLRGLAALCVYLSHNISWYYDPTDAIQDGFGWRNNGYYIASLPFIRVFFTGGSSAVAIFFVLSGFVLSRSALRVIRDGQKPHNLLLSATIRRPLRLYTPPAVISLIVAILFQTPLGPMLAWPTPQANIVAELLNWLKETIYAFNPFVEHAPFTSWYPYNPPVWTMPTEFKGSILVFSTLALFARFTCRQRMLLFSLAAVVLLFIGSWAMSCFMAGVVLAMIDLESLDETILTRMSQQARNTILHIIFFVGWYFLSQVAVQNQVERSYETFGWYWLTMVVPKFYYNKEYWRFWHSIGAVLVVYAILRIRWLQVHLASLKYLGRVSFSFYLIHTPMLWIAADRMYRLIGHKRPEQPAASVFDNKTTLPAFGPRGLTTDFIICQSILLPVTLILAQVSTTYIDDPSMAIAKRFSAWAMAKLGRSEK